MAKKNQEFRVKMRQNTLKAWEVNQMRAHEKTAHQVGKFQADS